MSTESVRPRVFLSCLGTGKYAPVAYVPVGGGETIITPYIQEARLVELLAAEGTPITAVMLLTTGARSEHWEGKLADRLAALAPDRLTIDPVAIPDGASPEQHWTIFEAIVSRIPVGARVFFDMTHSFRTLPAIALQALTYAENLSGASLEELSYGAFDAQRAGVTPTWDLREFMVLRDWSTGLAHFKLTGDTRPLARLAAPLGRALGRQLGRSTPAALNALAGCLDRFGDAIAHCRSHLIGPEAERLRHTCLAAAEACAAFHGYAPVRRILDAMVAALADFPRDPGGSEDLRTQRAAIEWTSSHGLHVQALTLLREAMVTALAARAGNAQLPRDAQDTFVGAVALVLQGKTLADSDPWAHEARTFAERCVADGLREVGGRLDTVRVRRNALNHACTGKEPSAAGSPSELRQLVLDTTPLLVRLTTLPRIHEEIA